MLRPDERAPVDRPTSPTDLDGPSGSFPSLDPRQGVRFPRRYTRAGTHPYDEIEWEVRDAVITNERGEIAFEQRNVEVPKSWSQLATNVVAQKYFRGVLGTPERENERAPAHRPRGPHGRALGARRPATSPRSSTPRRSRPS